MSTGDLIKYEIVCIKQTAHKGLVKLLNADLALLGKGHPNYEELLRQKKEQEISIETNNKELNRLYPLIKNQLKDQ